MKRRNSKTNISTGYKCSDRNRVTNWGKNENEGARGKREMEKKKNLRPLKTPLFGLNITHRNF